MQECTCSLGMPGATWNMGGRAGLLSAEGQWVCDQRGREADEN